MKIGIFDSGIGGLSVLHHAMKMMPNGNFIFFADEDNVPYGVKPVEDVKRYVAFAAEFLYRQRVDAIVIACNTATSVAARELRKTYSIPIIGMEPAVKLALDKYGQHRVLAAATPITVHGDKMQHLLDRVDYNGLVDLLPLPGLVEFAERGEFDSSAVRQYLEQELSKFNLQEYSSFVLGCTHFNYFKEVLRKILPRNMRLVDGNAGTVRELFRQLKLECDADGRVIFDGSNGFRSETEFYYSGRRVTDHAEIKRLIGYLEQLDRVYNIR